MAAIGAALLFTGVHFRRSRISLRDKFVCIGIAIHGVATFPSKQILSHKLWLSSILQVRFYLFLAVKLLAEPTLNDCLQFPTVICKVKSNVTVLS